MARIASVGTAVPLWELSRERAKRAAAEVFAEMPGAERLLGVFDSAGVERRFFCFPAAYYTSGHGFGRRNDDYIEQATELACRAAREALDAGKTARDSVGHVILVSTTGFATPSLDARLVQLLGLPRSVRRTPIQGVGCAGGVVALARAAEWLAARPNERVLVVSVELAGQTFDPRDRSPLNLVAAAIFGDGAAAAVVGGDEGPRIAATDSLLLDDSLDAMGWDMRDDGPRLVLSRRIPELIRRRAGAAVEGFLSRNGLGIADVGRWVVHPGGPKVLDAMRETLGLAPEALEGSREFMRNFGNLSSASVLFILKEQLSRIGAGEPVLVLAVGPGFSVEQVLIRG